MSRYFRPILTLSPPVTLCCTSRNPLKYVTHFGPPNFLVVHTYMQMSLQGVHLSSWGFLYRGFVRGFCLESLSGGRRGWFLSVPSFVIRYNRKLNITFNFQVSYVGHYMPNQPEN